MLGVAPPFPVFCFGNFLNGIGLVLYVYIVIQLLHATREARLTTHRHL